VIATLSVRLSFHWMELSMQCSRYEVFWCVCVLIRILIVDQRLGLTLLVYGFNSVGFELD
jgi:hypothetical protein